MIAENQLRALIDLVWTTTLQMELAPGSLLTAPERAYALAASVQVTGAWQGALVLECAPPLARCIAARLFNIDENEATPADMRDALGEIANIVGGNLKARLPGPSALSLPMVTQGSDFLISILRSRRVCQAGFVCSGHPFAASLYERLPATPGLCCCEESAVCG
ncbi:MAG: chemotaxis protein CheX [Pirellulales bacterium]|nr:chemotaxis protein CheX [Pirellulales bacterium]